jgi:hypothetical protein
MKLIAMYSLNRFTGLSSRFGRQNAIKGSALRPLA